MGLATIFIYAKQIQIFDACQGKTRQRGIVVKSLAHFNTQFKVKERFKLVLAIKVKKTL